MNTSACGTGSSRREPIEGELQPGLGHDDAVLLDAVGEQVDVAEVGDREPGAGVVAVLHAQTLAPESPETITGQVRLTAHTAGGLVDLQPGR